MSNNHDLSKPQQYWHQLDAGRDTWHVIFRTRKCNWGVCRMCALPQTGDDEVKIHDIIDQIDCSLDDVVPLSYVQALTLGNNGSLLDETTFPVAALDYLLLKAQLVHPELERLSLITLPTYATQASLGQIAQQLVSFRAFTLREGAVLKPLDIEVTVGLETLNPAAEEWILKHKTVRKTQQEVEGLCERLALARKTAVALAGGTEAEAALVAPTFSLRAYFLIKPYPLSDDQAVADVQAGMKYLVDLSKEHGIQTTLHLNPVYVARDTPLVALLRAGKYSPPSGVVVARALIAAGLEWAKPGASTDVRLGLYDEDLAVLGGSFQPEDVSSNPVWKALADFNSVPRRAESFEAVRAALP